MSGTATRRVAQLRNHGSVTVLLALALALGVLAVGVGAGSAAAQSENPDNKTAVAEFSATGTEGYIEVDNDNDDDPTATLPTPEEVDQPITINGEIFEDGTVQTTEISFPDIEVFSGIGVGIEAPEPLTGEIDREAGVLNINGSLRISIISDGAVAGTINVSANLTTEESNEMEGDASGLDTESATVRLVDNQFIISEKTNTFADSFLGLPSTTPGRNWFSLSLDMEIQQKTGTVAGVVESASGDPIEGATVTADGEDTRTAADGSYQLDVEAGTREITAGQLGFSSASKSVTVRDNETTTADFTLEAAETGTISGTVTSTEGGPIGGATVAIGSQETTTGGDGSYQLDVSAGSATVTVDAQSFIGASESVTVGAGETTTVDIALEPGGATFSPTAVFAEDGEAGDTVEIRGLVQNTGESTGTRNVTFTVGEHSDTQSLELAPGAVQEVTFNWETDGDDGGNYEAELTTTEGSASTTFFLTPPNINVTVDAPTVAPGENATATVTISNEDTINVSRNVTVSLANESTEERINLTPGTSDTVELVWQTTEDDEGTYTATVDVGDQTVEETLIVRQASDEGADFRATSTGGYMNYDESTYDAARGGGLEFPNVNEGEDPIIIEGEINEETGTWNSTYTFFPDITQMGISGTVTAPNGLRGQIDRDEGFLTATGTFKVLIDRGVSFTFNMTMTTGQSGEITDAGDYTTVNDTFTTINFVSNNFAVTDETGDGIVDQTLSLPSPDPSRNYMELGFEVNFDPEEVNRQDDSGDNTTTKKNGTTAASVGKLVGGIGVIAALVFIVAGLYVRVVDQ